MSKTMRFTIFCIENYKVHRSMTGKQVYVLFEKHGVFAYLEKHYEVLHSTGYQYINQDIDRFLQARNVHV